MSKRHGIAAWMLILALAVTACSKQRNVLASNQPATSPSQLPFDLTSENKGRSPTATLKEELPAGTEIVIRLCASLSSGAAQSGETFQAQLEQPLVLDGRTVAPRGSAVIGRVVSAKAAAGVNDPGYLRLTLSSIAVANRNLSLETASIFAKGVRNHSPYRTLTDLPATETGEIRGSVIPTGNESTFSTGRTLTFHLAKSLLVPEAAKPTLVIP